MVDVFSKKKRSEIMSRIRGKNTSIEMLVFRELRKRKIYFQRHYKRTAGNPDVAIPRKKKALFIDGNFWHGFQFTKNRKRLPSRYWIDKIEKNIKRDRKNRTRLKKEGWTVMRIWESQIEKDVEESLDKITKFLRK